MTEAAQKILADWQVRKTKKQKTAFIAFLKEYYPDLRVEQYGGRGSRNLVLGDVASADVVFTAHYDTCAELPFPNFVTPKNFLLYLLYSIFVAIVLLAVSFLTAGVVGLLTRSVWLGYWAGVAVLLLCLILIYVGRANPHTVNDNTSGVITLCELMDALSEEEKTRAAFVFFDNEELGLVGSSRFRSTHRKEMKGKLLVNLDCVSEGDSILIVQNRRARHAYGEILQKVFTSTEEKGILLERTSTAFYPSDQMGFPCNVAIAALRHHPILGYYIGRIHTRRDTVLDERNIAYLRERLRVLLQEIGKMPASDTD